MTPSDSGTPLPGALSARLLEGCEALPAWWLAPLRAGRGAAEALGRAPVDFAQWDGSWNGFQEPFLAVADHVDALRNPVPMLSASLAESVAATENAGKAAAVETRLPGSIGTSRSEADVSSSSLGRSGSGASKRSPADGKSAKSASAPSLPASALPSSGQALPRASAAMGSVSLRTVNTVEASLGPWLTRAQKAIRRWAPTPSVSSARATNPGAANVPASRAVTVDSPEAQAWFGAWVKDAASADPAQPTRASSPASPEAESRLAGAGAPGATAAIPSPKRPVGGAADAGSHKTGRPVRTLARTSAWTDILDELMPRTSLGAQAFPSSGADSSPAIGAIPPGPRKPKEPPGIANELTSKVRPGDDTSRPGASAHGDVPLPKGASATEWLDEEEDLAGKLHRLLRRQAKRRGVDLS